MSEVDIYKPRGTVAAATPDASDTDSWILVCSDVIKVANVICDTPFVPEGLRGSGPAVAAAILAGRELGLAPLTSLANIHIIKGKPSLAAVLMRALIQAQGHDWQDGHVSDISATVRGRRKGQSEWTDVTFTADQAKRAGIDLGKYPQDKLYARATSRLARRKFADVIAGMPYSAEELEDGDEQQQIEQAAPAAIAAPAAPRTAQRRQAAAKPERPTAAPPAGGSAATNGHAPARTAPSAPDLPPLPGEDDPSPEAPKQEAGPAMATGGQVGIIQSHFRRLGYDEADRTERLVITAQIAGIDGEIGSSKELTQEQASAVADTLSRCRGRERLVALLVAGDNPEQGTAGDGS